jgi:ATP-dependent RNA helicase DeaD
MLAGRDVLAQAATGTGKTAAFALPMLQRISDDMKRRVAAMVLVPTRELAMQVAEAIHKYGRSAGVTVLPLYGGAPMHQQIRALERGPHVIVATPRACPRSHPARHTQARPTGASGAGRS